MSLSYSLMGTHGGVQRDYSRYVNPELSAVTKTNKLSDPDQLTFTLCSLLDGSFVKLTRGDYIVFNTTTYGQWFTGYITNDPEPQFIGTQGTTPVYAYTYTAFSDDLLLNLSPIGLNLVYVNTTYGQILAQLANTLQPGVFDTSGIQNGPTVGQYIVDPTKSFSDIVKEFTQSTMYLFSAKNHKLFFAPIDAQPQTVTINGNSKHYTPSRLQIKPTEDQIINDAIVLGGVEPQGHMVEYFVGDGFTGQFPLHAGVYGLQKSVILDEDFSESSIDTTKWVVTDATSTVLQVSQGFLNALGGSNNSSFDVWLQSVDPFELEGHLRITQGEYDFVSASDGLIGAIYTASPTAPVSGVFNGCLYAIRVTKSGVNTLFNPVVNGVVDTTQSYLLSDYVNTRLVLRTIVGFNIAKRVTQPYNYIDSTGVLRTVGGSAKADTAYVQTLITAIDPNTGAVVNQITFITNSVPLTSTEVFAYYTPVVANDLHCTLTGITLSQPLQAALDVKSTLEPTFTVNGTGDITDTADAFHFLYQQMSGNFTVSARLASLQSFGSGNMKAGLMVRGALTAGAPEVSMLMSFAGQSFSKHRDTTGGATTTSVTASNLTPLYLQIVRNGNVFTINTSPDGQYWTQYDAITLAMTDPVFVGLAVCAESVTSTLLNTAVFDNLVFPSFTFTDLDIGAVNLVGSSSNTFNWTREIIGPNEIDSIDGRTPVATILDNNSSNGTLGQSSSQVNHSIRGSFQYNPSNDTLWYFKDSTNQISQVPNRGDLVRLRYRVAGVAMARVFNSTSVASEAAAWGDSGHRLVTRSDFQPLPRTSAECEAAAGALVGDSSFQHWDGTYTQYNGFDMAGEPTAGSILKFINVPADFGNLQAEVIQQVVTTFDSSIPVECFNHQITFGRLLLVQKLVDGLQKVKGLAVPQDAADFPNVIPLSLVGNTFVDDVKAPTLDSYDASNFHCNTNQAPPTNGGFEFRYTDDSWGADDAKNLVLRTTSQTFNVPRTLRGKQVYVRAHDSRNQILWSEDLTQAAWTKTNATVTNGTAQNPDGGLSLISTVNFTAASNSFVVQTSSVAIASTQVVASVSLKGPAGKTVSLRLQQSVTPFTQLATQNVVLTGGWQRVSVTFTGAAQAGNYNLQIVNASGAVLNGVEITRVGLEVGTPTETVYCKTNSTPYGVLSRYSAGLSMQLPLIPPPVANVVIDSSTATAPVLTLVMPNNETDIWGYEIRASDNVTVLQHITLGDAGYALTFTAPQPASRSLSYWVYTFNLFGEYSTGFHVTSTIATPSVSGVSVADATKSFVWTPANTTGVKVEVDNTSNAFTHIVFTNAKNSGSAQVLSDPDFFDQRWFRVTPFDGLGVGTAVVVSHIYTPAGVVEFNANEVASIPVPPNPTTDPSVPGALSDYPQDVIGAGWANRKINMGNY